MVMDEITMDVVNGQVWLWMGLRWDYDGWVRMEVVLEEVRIKMVVTMSQKQSGCGVDACFWDSCGQNEVRL